MPHAGDTTALIRRHDEVEAAAYRSLFAAAPAGLAQSLGLRVQEIGDACALLATGIPTHIFNRVIGLGNREPASAVALKNIETCYREAGVRDWWVHVSPTGRESQLLDSLSEQGYHLAERKAWAKMVHDATPAEPVMCQADVRELAPGEEIELAQTICTAFEMPSAMAPWFAALALQPQWRAVAAWRAGQIVGGGYLHLQGQYAWLGAGGVRPEARGLHVHRALMAKRIELALDAGCTQLFTETGEAVGDEPNPSLRNMLACGFTRAFSRLNYRAPVE